jgi:hypothetical protein
MSLSHTLRVLALSGLVTCAFSAQAKQWAIVVGIDKYSFKPLKGAVNDAKLLAAALRRHGMDLPDSRILLDEKATLANFKQTWNQVLTEAKPGDQILLTFAGHGAQEYEFTPPYDEKDIVSGQKYGKDETLLFYDFDPKNPQRGRISDDELYELFEKAKAYSILFVADSCHSGGITRATPSFSALPKRGGLDTFKPNPPDYERIIPLADDSRILEHVTYLAATENEALEIPEIYGPDQQPHGALSWTFSQALDGAADRNGDHIVTQRELEEYVKEQVPRLTANRQAPGLISRGLSRESPAFTITPSTGNETAAPPPLEANLAVKIDGGALPSGITGVRLDDAGYRIRFEIKNGQVSAFNPHGDKVTAFSVSDIEAWKRIIAKYRMIAVLDAHYNTSASPVKIALKQGNGLHRLNEHLDFTFDPNSSWRHFLLFDLAGTGELQFLYPLKEQGDAPALANIPYTLPLNVTPPTGEDDLVVVFCAGSQEKAVALLSSYNGKTSPTAETFLETLGKDCQIGRYAFFTSDGSETNMPVQEPSKIEAPPMTPAPTSNDRQQAEELTRIKIEQQQAKQQHDAIEQASAGAFYDYARLQAADRKNRLMYMHFNGWPEDFRGEFGLSDAPRLTALSLITGKPIEAFLLLHVEKVNGDTAMAKWPSPLVLQQVSGKISQSGWYILRGQITGNDAAGGDTGLLAGKINVESATFCEQEYCADVNDPVGLVRRNFNLPFREIKLPDWNPNRFDDFDACSGEGCNENGTFTAKVDTIAHAHRSGQAPVAFEIKKGEKVLALSTIVTTEPVPIKVITPFKIGQEYAQPGEMLYEVTYEGEGFCKVLYKGKLVEGIDLDIGRTVERLKDRDQSKDEDWTKVRNTKGQEGWVKPDATIFWGTSEYDDSKEKAEFDRTLNNNNGVNQKGSPDADIQKL